MSVCDIADAPSASSSASHSAQPRPVFARTASSRMPAIAAWSAAGALRVAAALLAAVAGVFFFASTRARAVVYDSPVFCMRARTRRFRSLFLGIAVARLGRTQRAPQRRRRARRTKERCTIRGYAPLCLARTHAGGGSRGWARIEPPGRHGSAQRGPVKAIGSRCGRGGLADRQREEAGFRSTAHGARSGQEFGQRPMRERLGFDRNGNALWSVTTWPTSCWSTNSGSGGIARDV